MCKARIWRARVGLFRTVEIVPRWGTRWLFNRLRDRQTVDDFHHAPCCPANHWSRQRLVFNNCNCGAAAAAR
jgi:hypothetical protein